MDNIKTWEQLDNRKMPEWFKKLKFGIFVHWGIYSVPAYAPRRNQVDSTGEAYSEWYGGLVRDKHPQFCEHHEKTYANAPYEQFVDKFTGENFDADEWISLFKESGAKYLTMVTKHHDGFTLFGSKYAQGWNSVEIGPKRDVLKELYQACDKYGIVRGAYYSLLEWPRPVFSSAPLNWETAEKYATQTMLPQLKELVSEYEPKIIYADGEWDFSSAVWHSREFLTWLYEESPVKDTVVVNDRWGSECRGVHGGFKTCEYGEVNSNAISEEEAKQNLGKYYWEECRSIGNSFGYNMNEDEEDYLTVGSLIRLLVTTVSKGGNLCLNVGPRADGKIPPIAVERLKGLGAWLSVNGDAIYNTEMTPWQGENGVCYTKNGNCIYAVVTEKCNAELRLEKGKGKVASVEVLGGDNVMFTEDGNFITVSLPENVANRAGGENPFALKIIKE